MLTNQRVTRCRADLQVFWCKQSQPSDATDWSPFCLGVADHHGCKLFLRLGQTRIDGVLRVPWLFDLLVLHGAARQSVVWPHRLVARWQASSWWSSWCWRPRGGRSPCRCQYRPPSRTHDVLAVQDWLSCDCFCSFDWKLIGIHLNAFPAVGVALAY